jgi:putative Mg2+ transporter-C (MgtC) family protein
MALTEEQISILIRLVAALAAGGLIGLERSYRGRPAGFRTHALVCMASSMLMLVTVYQSEWFTIGPTETVRIDPTRMAQGIMTGIGFLGAGVIMREGLTVRGLTTAASIWITAGIGILAGIGFYFPAAVATVLVLGTLALFRWIEARMPVQIYSQFHIRFARGNAMSEEDLRALVSGLGFTIANLHYRLEDGGRYLEYRMVIRCTAHSQLQRLVSTLEKLPIVYEFRIAPTGD